MILFTCSERVGGEKRKEKKIFNLDIWFYLNTPNKNLFFLFFFFCDGQNWNFRSFSGGSQKLQTFYLSFSPYFCPNEKSGSGWMFTPSTFSSFIYYNANQIKETVMSEQFYFPSSVSKQSIKKRKRKKEVIDWKITQFNCIRIGPKQEHVTSAYQTFGCIAWCGSNPHFGLAH